MPKCCHLTMTRNCQSDALIKFKKSSPVWTEGKTLTPNGVFDKVVLINLDRRPDRLAHAVEQCEKVGIQFEKVSGIDGQSKEWQETLSAEKQLVHGVDSCRHAANNANLRGVLQRAITENWKSFLWLEDDVIFSDDFNGRFSRNIRYVPDDWLCGKIPM